MPGPCVVKKSEIKNFRDAQKYEDVFENIATEDEQNVDFEYGERARKCKSKSIPSASLDNTSNNTKYDTLLRGPESSINEPNPILNTIPETLF